MGEDSFGLPVGQVFAVPGEVAPAQPGALAGALGQYQMLTT